MTRYLQIDDHHQASLVLAALRLLLAQASLCHTPGKTELVTALVDRARALCATEDPAISFAAILPADAPSGTFRLLHSSDPRCAVGYALLDRENARPLGEIAAQLCRNLSLDPLPRARPIEHIEDRGFRLLGAQVRA